MNIIQLKSNKGQTIVDDDDFALLSRHVWSLHSEGYAICRTVNGSNVFLHRLVMGTSPKVGLYVDHINRDKLDNRKENLRFVTNSENQFNRAVSAKNTGVTWHTASGKWRARMRINGKELYLGIFNKKQEAVKARHEALRKHGKL